MNIATRSRILDNNTDSESTEVRSPPSSKTTIMNSPGGETQAGASTETGASASSLFSSFMPSSTWRSPSTSMNEDDSNGFASIPEEARSDLPVSLEGTLFFRKCKSSKDSKSWKQVYVVLNLTNEGSLACYSPTGDNFSNKKRGRPSLSAQVSSSNLKPKLYLPPYVNWIAKDIENNSTGFVIEVSTVDPTMHVGSFSSDEPNARTSSDEDNGADGAHDDGPASSSASMRCLAGNGPPVPIEIQDDVRRAREKNDNFRIYFKCGRSGNEKVLWLRALEQVDRLSYDLHKQKGIIHTLANPSLKMSHSRVRSHNAQRFALEGRFLDDRSVESQIDDPGSELRERTKSKGGKKEYLVYPLYAYPNRWMTDSELYAEMLKPSEIYYDTRVSDSPHKEIGVLKVELLQCIGLPALDFASETDATAYMVCGSHAFTTDVIWNRLNPMWLPRSRRACIFPLHHAYARLFVGIFDDDGKGEKDDFAGRVVVDLARCRPRSTYDVTLPLRLSAHVYSRRPRGSIRLRFSVDWHSERDAMLSYIPKNIRPPMGPRPDDDVTILCSDEKAFRNIATTVHGIHMPGRFSFSQWKSTMREANFARKTLENVLRKLVIDIVIWKNPSLSLLVFSSWMFIIYRNSFALVPLHIMCFLTLMMMRTYVFFGTDGPIQNGFIPPSWEEMAMALLSGKKGKVIEPLRVKPNRLRSGSFRDNKPLGFTEPPETHKPRGKWLFRLLGFKAADELLKPDGYHMEFPFSQGLKDPTVGQIQYPKFRVRESLVSKSSLINRKGKGSAGGAADDGDENMLGDLLATKSTPAKRKKTFTFSRNSSSKSIDENKKEQEQSSSARSLGRNEQFEQARGSGDASEFIGVPFEELPPYLRIPEQNIDAKGPAKKKKLADELDELQENMHKMTFHVFNDRTHVVRHPESVYFGQASKADWFKNYNVEADLERLLNIGQFSSANPVVARVGTYVEPIIHAGLSGLGLYRSIYNIATWRDPILSFWVSVAMVASIFVLAIFPWRLFFFGLGIVLVGPQNWIIRLMEERGTTPSFIKKRLDKIKKQKKKKKVKGAVTKELPKGQPVVGCHTSDNSPPHTFTPDEVDAREIHQVSIPYSQLMTQRFYDWPPEPHYAKCEPTMDINQSQRHRNASFTSRSLPAQRRQSYHASSAGSIPSLPPPSPMNGVNRRSLSRRATG